MTVIVVDCPNRSLALTDDSLGLAPKTEPVSVSGSGRTSTAFLTAQDNISSQFFVVFRSSLMATEYFQSSLARKQSGLVDGLDSPTSPASTQPRNNPLATKVTSVLSASYADSDIRDALNLLDKRGVENNPETRRQLRLDAQKEVIESNGDIIREFGHVAEVCLVLLSLWSSY